MRHRDDAASGLVAAIFVAGFPVVALDVLTRHLAAGAPTALAITAIGVLGMLWVSICARLISTVRALRVGHEVAARGGVLWLASTLASLVAFVAPAGAKASTGPHHVVAPTSAVTYTVRPGDSLWSIAQNQLGDAHRWPEIFATTTGPVGAALESEPAMIRPGWRLELPTPPTTRANHETRDVQHAHVAHEPVVPHRDHSRHSGVIDASVGGIAAVPMVLAAKRRQDFLRQSREELGDEAVDAAIDSLRQLDPAVLAGLHLALGDEPNGVVDIDHLVESDAVPSGDPVVALLVGANAHAVRVAFARPGATLPVVDATVVAESAVTLSSHARCVLCDSPDAVMRALALRTSFDDVVLYLGGREDLDDEIASRCVTLERATPSPRPVTASRFVEPTIARNVRNDAPTPLGDVTVHLLRADPRVTGLVEEFLPALRRRCIEMTAYLAVHHHEPVTGDRLRTRVLGDGSDASVRTLSNTASAVRRALGTDEHGPRLRPVTPAGLYQLASVECDLVEFHRLVAAARRDEASDVAATLERALALVEGEPLATALRGFEWFLAEGHLARLQRDGEWAALRLAAEAMDVDDPDLAFWAIERGRLLDPYSDALEGALARVPRLREFRGDRASRAQHESVGAR